MRRGAYKKKGHRLVQTPEIATCGDCLAAWRGEHGPHLKTEVLVDGLRAAEWRVSPYRQPMRTFAYITLHVSGAKVMGGKGTEWSLVREGIPGTYVLGSGWYASHDIETGLELGILVLRELDGEREADLKKQGT